MLGNIKWLGHSSIKISGSKQIYIDPYNIKDEYKDADIIFITHSHYDHFSLDDIDKCRKNSTVLVITRDLEEKVKELNIQYIIVEPYNSYIVDNISFETIPSYNINKSYHPKNNNWVGYVININNNKYYVAGDTDITEETKKIVCDVAFLPIGGTYTMNYREAAELVNIIKPKYVIPIHYGTIVGDMDDALKFKELLDKDIICVIM